MSDTFNPHRQFICALVPNWIMRRKELSHGAKLLYGRLAQFAGKDGRANPGQRLLATELCVSERMVRKYVHELTSNNLIEVVRSGKTESNRYQFKKHEWMDGDRNKYSGQVGTLFPVTPDISSAHEGNNVSYKENHIKENQEVSNMRIPFEQFWDAYGKKVDKTKAQNKWDRLSTKDQQRAIEHVPGYVRATPDKQFRKNPVTYLNGKCWLDEDLPESIGKQHQSVPAGFPSGGAQ